VDEHFGDAVAEEVEDDGLAGLKRAIELSHVPEHGARRRDGTSGGADGIAVAGSIRRMQKSPAQSRAERGLGW